MSLKIENVSYTYMKDTPYERQALQEVTLEVQKGEFIAIIGHSGSGKSTLVQHMSGLLHPDIGRVLVEEVDLAEKKQEAKLAKRKIGLVFQYPEHQLFAETVYDDVAFGPRNFDLTEEEVAIRVKDALSFVHLSVEEYGARSPFRLSGGQMRRVAIAGVMAIQPDYLILDEPTAGLDPLMKNLFYQEIKELHKNNPIATILVTHSMEEAIELSDRLLVMSAGQIILDGNPREIFLQGKEELKKAGIDVPAIISLVDCLKRHGLKIDENCLSSKALIGQIMQNVGKEG